MVGDNPASDIAGANNFGWQSILVRTGVFKGFEPDEAIHVPTVVKEDVLVSWNPLLCFKNFLPVLTASFVSLFFTSKQDGVRWALEREGFGHVL